MKWYKAGELSENPIKKVTVNGKKICVVQHGEKVYAVSASCPHAGADMANGWCRDGRIVCPIHRYVYDLETGRGAAGQDDYIPVYPVEVRDNEVYIGLGSFWDGIKALFK